MFTHFEIPRGLRDLFRAPSAHEVLKPKSQTSSFLTPLLLTLPRLTGLLDVLP